MGHGRGERLPLYGDAENTRAIYDDLCLRLFTWSLRCFRVYTVRAAAKIAICGTPQPMSDIFGIPTAIYQGTLDCLNDRQLMKFHLRMAGDKTTFEAIRSKFPENAEIGNLKEELATIAGVQECKRQDSEYIFDRAYMAEHDRIFPYRNVFSYWEEHPETVKISMNTPHVVDLAAIIREVIPDTYVIGESFKSAKDTYNDTAIVQSEICRKIGDRLSLLLSEKSVRPTSLLEIGVGNGLLTHVWKRVVKPAKATFIDLQIMPQFGIAEKELYITTDAEKWLENTEEKFDIILSASTIQWFVDPVKFLYTVEQHLNPGGIAVISTFLKGNLWQLDQVRPSPIIYRTEVDYLSFPNVEVESWERTLQFDSSRDMLMHLRNTGVTLKKKRKNQEIRIGSPYPPDIGLTELPHELTYRPMILVIKG